MARTIQPDGWPRPSGYANGMEATGRILAVAGQVGWNRAGKLVSKDFVAQFVQALDNIIEVVRAAGGQPADIISMTIYVVDRLQYVASTEEIGVAWRARMGDHYPAMTLVVVPSVADPDARVEIQAMAVMA